MVRLTTTPPKSQVGVFGTPKPDGKIRVIIDARATNDLFCDPDPVQLPTPDLFARLSVPSRQPLYVAKCDLSDFFYRFRTPEWMHPYFGFPPITAGLIDMGAQFGDDTIVWPLFTVVPMGWSHSVLLTQTAHEHMLDTAPTLGALRREERITQTSDLRVDRVRHAVYIDDVIFFGLDKSQVEAAQSAYVAVANARHLPVKRTKVVAPSADGVEGLGMVIHGHEHTGRCITRQVVNSCAMTLVHLPLAVRLASGRRVPLQIVGRWTWTMLVARPALSVFNTVSKSSKPPAGRFLLHLAHRRGRTVDRSFGIVHHSSSSLIVAIRSGFLVCLHVMLHSTVKVCVTPTTIPKPSSALPHTRAFRNDILHPSVDFVFIYSTIPPVRVEVRRRCIMAGARAIINWFISL